MYWSDLLSLWLLPEVLHAAISETITIAVIMYFNITATLRILSRPLRVFDSSFIFVSPSFVPLKSVA